MFRGAGFSGHSVERAAGAGLILMLSGCKDVAYANDKLII